MRIIKQRPGFHFFLIKLPELSSCFLLLQNTALPRLYLCLLAVVKDGTATDGYRLTQAFCSDCSANDEKKAKRQNRKIVHIRQT